MLRRSPPGVEGQIGCWSWSCPTALPQAECRGMHMPLAHTHTHTHTHWNTHTSAHLHVRAHTLTYNHSHTCLYEHSHTCSQVHTHIQAHLKKKKREWMTTAEAGRTDRNQGRKSWWGGFCLCTSCTWNVHHSHVHTHSNLTQLPKELPSPSPLGPASTAQKRP